MRFRYAPFVRPALIPCRSHAETVKSLFSVSVPTSSATLLRFTRSHSTERSSTERVLFTG